MSSNYKRARDTAQYAGFRYVDTTDLIAEGGIPDGLLRGREVVLKHSRERWVPAELADRRDQFFDKVRSGEFEYDVYMSHGLFIASVILRLEEEWDKPEQFPFSFNQTRGYIPDLASVTTVKL